MWVGSSSTQAKESDTKQSDVVIGHEYNIRLDNKDVRVKVVGERGYGDGIFRKYIVKRIDTGRVLTKARTCASLHPISFAKDFADTFGKAPSQGFADGISASIEETKES